MGGAWQRHSPNIEDGGSKGVRALRFEFASTVEDSLFCCVSLNTMIIFFCIAIIVSSAIMSSLPSQSPPSSPSRPSSPTGIIVMVIAAPLVMCTVDTHQWHSNRDSSQVGSKIACRAQKCTPPRFYTVPAQCPLSARSVPAQCPLAFSTVPALSLILRIKKFSILQEDKEKRALWKMLEGTQRALSGH